MPGDVAFETNVLGSMFNAATASWHDSHRVPARRELRSHRPAHRSSHKRRHDELPDAGEVMASSDPTLIAMTANRTRVLSESFLGAEPYHTPASAGVELSAAGPYVELRSNHVVELASTADGSSVTPIHVVEIAPPIAPTDVDMVFDDDVASVDGQPSARSAHNISNTTDDPDMQIFGIPDNLEMQTGNVASMLQGDTLEAEQSLESIHTDLKSQCSASADGEIVRLCVCEVRACVRAL